MLDHLSNAVRPVHDEEWRSRPCLAACCAIALQVLFDLDRVATQMILQAGLAAMSGGAIFGNARVLLARAFGVRSEVISGGIARMLELSGKSGVVVLGVNPCKLYEGAAPGRHAILLTSSSAAAVPAWARGLIDAATAFPSQSATFIDASRGIPSKQLTTLPGLGAAFDAAGREALLIMPVRSQRRADDAFRLRGLELSHK